MNVALYTKEGAQRHIHTCLFGARGAGGANGLLERATPVGAELENHVHRIGLGAAGTEGVGGVSGRGGARRRGEAGLIGGSGRVW